MTDTLPVEAAEELEETLDTPHGVVEHRSATAMEVNYPQRLITLVAMPYNQETVIAHQGRLITEVCRPGAYSGVQRRLRKITVNRGHQIEAVCGRVQALHPSRAEGLVAEVRMAHTPLGDETLELSADGVLGASAGFLPMAGGEVWSPDRSRRELTRCFLHHIAMTADEAYPGAQVLDVRRREESPPGSPASAHTPTPNLDTVRAWLLQQRYDRIPT